MIPDPPGELLYRFVPTEEEQKRDTRAPEEIVLTAGYAYLRWSAGWEEIRLSFAGLAIARLLAERETLAHLAVENEKLEREMMAASILRDPAAKDWIHKLQNGLCQASNLARQMLGLPSIRDENRHASVPHRRFSS